MRKIFRSAHRVTKNLIQLLQCLHYQLVHLPIELRLTQFCLGAATLLHLLQGIGQPNGCQKVVECRHLLGCIGCLPQSVPQRQQRSRAPQTALIEQV